MRSHFCVFRPHSCRFSQLKWLEVRYLLDHQVIFSLPFRAFTLFFALSIPSVAQSQEATGEDTSFLGPFGPPLSAIFADGPLLSWLAGILVVIAVVLLIGHRLRLNRRVARLGIAGLRNGPRFRVVDAMCHAVWKGRKINETRLARALEIARGATDMDFSIDHIREIALRADRLIIPTNFYWMRDGLTVDEKMVIFNAALSVLLADGPLMRSDRAFLRTLARGLGLGRKQLRHLTHLTST